MSLTPGTRLGSYEILTHIGAGGMGEVYRARDIRLGREVAVKVLPADVASDVARLARFEHEARTVASLNHPNIVTLYSVEDVDGIRFLTMELVTGASLEQQVAPGGLPVERVLELGVALTDALAAAHEKGVVHRDLKPQNVMLTKDGVVKVLDFGLAKLEELDVNADAADPATRTAFSVAGQVVGTLPYMAPEQVRGDVVDSRTDLFALGVLLYELATGQRPFEGATVGVISSAILRDAPTSLTRLRADVPPALDRVISRCLEKEPGARFQTAGDMRRELQNVDRTPESEAIIVPPPVPSTPLLGREENVVSAVERLRKGARVHCETGWTALADKDAVAAQRAFRRAVLAYEEVGSPRGTGLALLGLAAVEAAEGRSERAVAIAEAAQSLTERAGVVCDHPMDPGVTDRIEALKLAIPKKKVDGLLADASTLSPAAVLAMVAGESD